MVAHTTGKKPSTTPILTATIIMHFMWLCASPGLGPESPQMSPTSLPYPLLRRAPRSWVTCPTLQNQPLSSQALGLGYLLTDTTPSGSESEPQVPWKSYTHPSKYVLSLSLRELWPPNECQHFVASVRGQLLEICKGIKINHKTQSVESLLAKDPSTQLVLTSHCDAT